jgi:hypothetical protein
MLRWLAAAGPEIVMDTHIIERTEIQIADIEDDASASPVPPHHQSEQGWPFWMEEALRGKRRAQVIAAASAAAILLAIGGFVSMTTRHHASVQVASGMAQTRQPLAQAATLARLPEPHHPPAAVYHASTTGGDDMAEFLRLGGKTPPDTQTATDAPNPPGRQKMVAAAPPMPAQRTIDIPAPSPLPVRPAAPAADPVTVATSLHPETMSDTNQVQVLELVTQLGALIRDQRSEILQLRADQKALTHRFDAGMDDVRRRLALAEARNAIGAAMAPTNPQPVSAAPPVQAPAPPAAIAANSGPRRYHVQAASPGLAMLSELDQSGGEIRQIPVAPGDDVPGWGKVISISQRGAAWLVKTGHGVIQ